MKEEYATGMGIFYSGTVCEMHPWPQHARLSYTSHDCSNLKMASEALADDKSEGVS